MPYSQVTAIEIDKKLRDDFRRRVKDFGISADVTDPILAVLFRTFAQQVETLYAETEGIRLALLDELMANLGIEPRMARPAQTVVRFLVDRGSQLIGAGSELVGEATSGERLAFMTDATINASEARIACAFTYQDGALRLSSSVELSEGLQMLRPALQPFAVSLGPNPALFLALENLPPDHLGFHSFFFELSPEAYRVQQALQTETWCLLNSAGELGATGILRPRSSNAGVCLLEWLLPDIGDGGLEPPSDAELPGLPSGFYGSRTFVFPSVPPGRRFRCQIPRAMESALRRIFGREYQKALAQERAWIRISLPSEVPPLDTAIGGISLHAVTASNVACFNQTISFEEQGTCVPVVREHGGRSSHLVAPLSIFGEGKAAYLPENRPCGDKATGRYAVRNGRIELRPALRPDGSPESYANVRLWVTEGSLGNSVGVGRITGFLKRNPDTVRVANLTAATGGSDMEDLAKAQARFADALLTRDRIVTRCDLLNAVRSFDHRIREADISPGLWRSEQGLERLERVRIRLDPDDFVDFNAELPVLKDGLRRHLLSRFSMGTKLSIDVAPS